MLNWSKSESKDIYNVIRFYKHKAAQLFSTLIIRNVSWAVNQYIRIISEGSYDTEDWSNDAENVHLYTLRKKKSLKL